MGRKLSDVLNSLPEERRQRIAKDRDELLMKPSTQADLDAAAVKRSLAILRTARAEIDGWRGITLDADARENMLNIMNGLQDLEHDLRYSTKDIREKGLVK